MDVSLCTQHMLMNCAQFLGLADLQAGTVSVVTGCAALAKLLDFSEFSGSHNTNALRWESVLVDSTLLRRHLLRHLLSCCPLQAEVAGLGRRRDHFPSVSAVCLTEGCDNPQDTLEV